MFLIVRHLNLAAARRFLNGKVHGISALIRIHDHAAGNVACGAPDGLDERTVIAQEALFIGIEDGHERHFGQVKALTQQIDTH